MEAQKPMRARSRFLTGCVVLLAAVVVVVGVLVVSSMIFAKKRGGRMAGAPSEMMTEMAPEAEAMRQPMAGGTADKQALGEGASSRLLSSAEAAMPRREIIYTGEMRVEVNDVEAAMGRVEKTAAAAGGWVSNRQFEKDAEGRRTATVSVRVPAARFAETHAAMLALGEVTRDSMQSQDVGKEFVSLEARLNNLQREETVVVALFNREGKIADILSVEQELARVRGEIEETQGQLRYLKDQVGYSTLTVMLAPKRPEIERKMESWNLGYHVLRAWRALVAVARGLTYFVIYAVIVVGPFVLIAWLVWLAVRAGRRRRPPKPHLPPAA